MDSPQLLESAPGGGPRMRLLLVQTAHGLTPSSGGYKANVCLLRNLSMLGHATAQVCYAFPKELEEYVRRAKAKGVNPNLQGLEPVQVTDGKNQQHKLHINEFTDEWGIRNTTIARHDSRIKGLTDVYANAINDFKPTHVLFNDALTMKLTAGHVLRESFKRVCVVHSAEQLPFGPYCAGVEGHCISAKVENEMLRKLDGVWSVSKAIQRYAWEHGRLQTKFLAHTPWTFLDLDTGRMPIIRNNVDKEEIGMVNPAPIKGLDILLGLAAKFPHMKFVTWTSWGSKPRHIERLKAYPNIRIEATTPNTNDIWDRIKILLAPSIWHEAWGLIVTEAQLRGIPVIASNSGGLPEAKVNVPPIIPINPVTGHHRDENEDYIIPEQDFGPWEEVLEKLMTDREEYLTLAALSAVKTAGWLKSVGQRTHERWFQSMM
ncbi:putative glycosyltransferase [Triangularia setosa]|uniref:Glycosyltransferase n=1 Tax=Triangularia setosa TaxID=2587417 RepID=A0AAN6WCI6_9PEZI|nr:putative glycosyltransferase [Podospora setosa]